MNQYQPLYAVLGSRRIIFVPQESVIKAVEELVDSGMPRHEATRQALETQGHAAGDYVAVESLIETDWTMLRALYGIEALQGECRLERG